MSDPKPSIPKRFLSNPKAQLGLLLFAIIYMISPVDFIPDVMPIVGWVDDLGILLAEIINLGLYLKNKRREFNVNAVKHEGEE